MDVPATPAEISASDLNEVAAAACAGGTVAEVRCSDIGEGTGIFGQIARLDVTVDGDDGSAPASLIAKMACIEPANLEIAQMLGLYEREINMFEHVLDDTPIRTPVCHAAVRSDDGRFLLLLEDLSVDYQVGDQIVGATLEQAARRWQRPIHVVDIDARSVL
jgi:hypothetical protein